MSRPNLSYLKNIILAIFGIPCGILTGLTGISNTYFASPMLSKMIGASGARLIGSTLAIATFSALTGLLAYGQMHAVNFVSTLMIAVGFVIGAYATRQFMRTPEIRIGSRKVGVVAGILLGAFMIAEARRIIACPSPIYQLSHALYHDGAILAGVIWLAVGVLIGALGSGLDLGGLLIVPALHYMVGNPMYEAQGAALTILLITSILPLLAHASGNAIEPKSAVWVSLGALFGALIGSRIMAANPHDGNLAFIYGALLILAILFRYSWPSPVQKKPEEV